MSAKKTFIFIAFTAAIFMAFGFQNSSEHKVLFEKAKFTMETKGDLKGAIKLFNEIIKKYPAEREYAAKSQLYIGLCYEKLGLEQAKHAQKAFQEVVDNYPEQTEAVKVAKEKLAKFSKALEEKPQKPSFRKIKIPYPVGDYRSGSQFSPDGKKLVYFHDGSIWVAPVPGMDPPDKGGAPVELAEAKERWGVGPVWSADGRWIAYNNVKIIGKRPGHRGEPSRDINVIPSAGDEPKKVVFSTKKRDFTLLYHLSLSLSPDGKVLAFASGEQIGPGKVKNVSIYTIPVEGGVAKRLTDATTFAPAFSPDGTKIAYMKAYTPKEGKWISEIWVIPAVGGTPIQVSDLRGRAKMPMWSPDGKMIAFLFGPTASHASNEICIARISREGKPIGALTKISLPRSGLNFAGWTSDNKIGFIFKDLYSIALYTAPASGGKATQIASPSNAWYPRWSTDGKMIYFYNLGNIISVPSIGGKVSTVPIRSDPKILSPTLIGLGHDVSPDGKKIVFAGPKPDKSDKDGISSALNIWTISVEGGEPAELTTSSFLDLYPCWSPDGKSIAFIRVNSPRWTNPNRGWPANIFTVPAEGGEVRQITSLSDKVSVSPKWSPDGKSIAYFSQDNTINVIPVDGGESRVVVKPVEKVENALNFELTWSPDGKKIAYTPGEGSMWMVSLDEGKQEKVKTGWDGGHAHLDWSPDGKKIVFTGFKGGGTNLLLMENFLPLPSEIAQQKVDYRKIVGAWEVVVELFQYMKFSLNIEESYGKLTGTISDFSGWEAPFSQIMYDGNNLNFEFADNIHLGENKHIIKAEFKVNKDKLEGFMIIEELAVKAPATATRKKK